MTSWVILQPLLGKFLNEESKKNKKKICPMSQYCFSCFCEYFTQNATNLEILLTMTQSVLLGKKQTKALTLNLKLRDKIQQLWLAATGLLQCSATSSIRGSRGSPESSIGSLDHSARRECCSSKWVDSSPAFQWLWTTVFQPQWSPLAILSGGQGSTGVTFSYT